ncbi:unnamed protein product [Ixodes pacificus]
MHDALRLREREMMASVLYLLPQYILYADAIVNMLIQILGIVTQLFFVLVKWAPILVVEESCFFLFLFRIL